MCGFIHTMSELELLKELGLNDTEAIIYLQLLKKGLMGAVDLSKNTKIHRRTIYDNLNILINKGFVTFIVKNEVKYFSANNPKIFNSLIQEKTNALNILMPILSEYYQNKKKNPEVLILQGIDSTKAIFEEMLQTKKEILWMGGGSKIFQNLDYSIKNMFKRLSKKNFKIIQPKTKEISELKKFFSKNIRTISKKYESQVSFFIYENNVILGLIINNENFVIRIENYDFSKAYTNYFNIIWSIAK